MLAEAERSNLHVMAGSHIQRPYVRCHWPRRWWTPPRYWRDSPYGENSLQVGPLRIGWPSRERRRRGRMVT